MGKDQALKRKRQANTGSSKGKTLGWGLGITPCLSLLLAATMLEPAKAKPLSEIERLQVWKADLWQEAKGQGISKALFDKAIIPAAPNYRLPRVHKESYWRAVKQQAAKAAKTNRPLRPLRKGVLPPSCTRPRQKEFLFPTLYFPKPYFARLVAKGKQLRRQHQTTFARIEQQFGVEMRAVLGIWGRETAYGQVGNKYDGIRTWLSLAYAGAPEKRPAHRQNLLYALKFIDEGHISLKAYKTTYAGATGYPQFTPDVFAKYAVDFDGDGRKNIWASIPDALASAANYLKGIGWQKDVPWGMEVQVPEGFDCAVEGPHNRRSIADWQKLGVKPMDPQTSKTSIFATPALAAQFVAPAGMKGPKFLVTENFEVFRRYNKADLYALFVGHLGDNIWCAADERCAFKTPWPQKDHFNFSRKRICELQQHLKSRRASNETPDGLFGGKTRNGIGTYENQSGLKTTCFPSKAVLKKIRAETTP